MARIAAGLSSRAPARNRRRPERGPLVFHRTVRLVGCWSRTDYIAFRILSVSLPSFPPSPMQLSPNQAPWQVAPVSATGRVAAASLSLLAFDSIFVWSMTTSVIEAAALTAIPAVVAIRVIRGFPWSRELAAATFASSLAIAIATLFQREIATGQTRAAIVVAIALSAAGLLTLAWSARRNGPSTQPVTAMPRWPSVPVAARSPSRYRTHRQYR